MMSRPSGFRILDAILASHLLGAMPMEALIHGLTCWAMVDLIFRAICFVVFGWRRL